MPKVTLFKQDGAQAGDFELEASVFGIEPNEPVMRDVVNMQRASLRQGTHKVKNRSEVRGGGIKPWRQKGTGRARQGSIRSPQWVGGGTVFGPTPRTYSYKLPKKVRRLALKSALSSKVAEENVVVLDDLQFEEPKTKDAVKMLEALKVDSNALIVTTAKEDNVVRSTNNLQNVTVRTVGNVNVLDLLMHDKLIITKDAAEKAGEVLV
ncbi:MAG TPA: 50S ribosomal protein L4 [Virgibacillus sp.]|nr:50S ribosomal protein L4 [Virgibacillus sp.]